MNISPDEVFRTAPKPSAIGGLKTRGCDSITCCFRRYVRLRGPRLRPFLSLRGGSGRRCPVKIRTNGNGLLLRVSRSGKAWSETGILKMDRRELAASMAAAVTVGSRATRALAADGGKPVRAEPLDGSN